ncbi:hypothetical protein E2986_11966 [Frieseomelitta varia]|uniref:Uncharacterized protein n=1 Tax=Frieseomelitta varia TaxID=561572 RepID=A0A833SFR2_9HYME|nr:hypothetical protein E2986_11966 [Frieseomelitta varia]
MNSHICRRNIKLVFDSDIVLNTGGIKPTKGRRTSAETIRATEEATKLACTVHYTLTLQPALPRPSPTTLYPRSPSLAARREMSFNVSTIGDDYHDYIDNMFQTRISMQYTVVFTMKYRKWFRLGLK